MQWRRRGLPWRLPVKVLRCLQSTGEIFLESTDEGMIALLPGWAWTSLMDCDVASLPPCGPSCPLRTQTKCSCWQSLRLQPSILGFLMNPPIPTFALVTSSSVFRALFSTAEIIVYKHALAFRLLGLISTEHISTKAGWFAHYLLCLAFSAMLRTCLIINEWDCYNSNGQIWVSPGYHLIEQDPFSTLIRYKDHTSGFWTTSSQSLCPYGQIFFGQPLINFSVLGEINAFLMVLKL